MIGDDEIEAAIQAAKPGVPVVTPPMAGVRGLKALGAKRISVLTPYTVETSRPMADLFRRAQASRSTASPALASRTTARWRASRRRRSSTGARGDRTPNADALFMSCTALRGALRVMPASKQAIGRPVVTSNQASAWKCLRLCGDNDVAARIRPADDAAVAVSD